MNKRIAKKKIKMHIKNHKKLLRKQGKIISNRKIKSKYYKIEPIVVYQSLDQLNQSYNRDLLNQVRQRTEVFTLRNETGMPLDKGTEYDYY